MDAREALAQVERIREQLARAESFRAFRAASTGVTGVIAFMAAVLQVRLGIADPHNFLILWVIAAAVSILIVGIDIKLRVMNSDSMLVRDSAVVAARQFVPCVVAGALMTLIIRRCAPDSSHLLPGLWSILFSLGIFASRPGLPRAINLAAGYYLVSGMFILAKTDAVTAFDAWPMALSFGGGQLLTAGILYFCSMNENQYES